MSKFACERITVPRKSKNNLHHDAHLQDKDPSVKSLVKADFSNMLAKHAVTNTVTSRQGTGFSLAEDWGGGLPAHSTTTHEHAAGTGSPSLNPFSQWPPSTWEKIQLLQMKEQKNGKIITNNKLDEKSNEVNIKTPVAYYMPGEEVAYMSTFNGSNITLNQFKQLITKKGAFRYFFKTKCNLLDDEECVVFQEATDDNSYVPMFNNKVIAKIEKISN